jgi:hypothetical protein
MNVSTGRDIGAHFRWDILDMQPHKNRRAFDVRQKLCHAVPQHRQFSRAPAGIPMLAGPGRGVSQL